MVHNPSKMKIKPDISLIKYFLFVEMNLTIGQRIVIKQNDKSHLATLAWEGELPGKKGSWYGIVYDEPQATGLSNFGSIVKLVKVLTSRIRVCTEGKIC